MLQITNKVFFFLSCLRVKLQSNLIIPVGDFFIFNYSYYSLYIIQWKYYVSEYSKQTFNLRRMKASASPDSEKTRSLGLYCQVNMFVKVSTLMEKKSLRRLSAENIISVRW